MLVLGNISPAFPHATADIYRVELHIDSDRVLRLAEAAGRLGFVVLVHG